MNELWLFVNMINLVKLQRKGISNWHPIQEKVVRKKNNKFADRKFYSTVLLTCVPALVFSPKRCLQIAKVLVFLTFL